jgi:hypothetical protein
MFKPPCCAPLLPVLAIVMILIGGCATGLSDPPHSDPFCPPVPDYPKTTLHRAADELKALPSGSAIEQMLGDYQVMRDQARSCARAG